MARYVFKLPDVGEGIAEAEIAQWHVAVGDRVAEDSALVDVMTDKATVDMTSPVSGVVVAIHGDVGDRVAVGSPLVELEIEDSAAANTEPVPSDSPSSAAAAVRTTKLATETASATETSPNTPAPAAARTPLAAPATRRRAAELGIALEDVPGTGPGGRITPQDLERFIASKGATQPTAAQQTGVRQIKIVGLRRKIAEKMQEAKRHIPHFGYVEEFDLTQLEELRQALNGNRTETQPKLTLLPFFMRAIVLLRPEFPQVNARYDDEAGVLQQYEAVHIGIATQTQNGLMVPVVHHAETLDLWGCARELLRVSSAARDGSATKAELTGSTITLTSLGTLGGIASMPVINYPEVAIVAPNRLVERPVVLNGQIAVRKMMNVSSAFDHRIVDGYDAARFIQRMKQLLENPALLFVGNA